MSQRAGNPREQEPFVAIVARHWGDDAPEWVVALAQEADCTSQAAVARRIGYTASVISSVLRNSYKAGLGAIAGKVNGVLLGDEVDCPVLGALRRDRCLAEQAKTFIGTSAVRTKLYHACRSGCPHSRLGARNKGGNNVDG